MYCVVVQVNEFDVSDRLWVAISIVWRTLINMVDFLLLYKGCYFYSLENSHKYGRFFTLIQFTQIYTQSRFLFGSYLISWAIITIGSLT
jgi:hypothetical protein